MNRRRSVALPSAALNHSKYCPGSLGPSGSFSHGASHRPLTVQRSFGLLAPSGEACRREHVAIETYLHGLIPGLQLRSQFFFFNFRGLGSKKSEIAIKLNHNRFWFADFLGVATFEIFCEFFVSEHVGKRGRFMFRDRKRHLSNFRTNWTEWPRWDRPFLFLSVLRTDVITRM